jgi:MFS family permease
MNTKKIEKQFVPLSIIISALYFSQGLPSGIIGHALPAMLREQNVGLEYIGLIKLLALPWVLKFLWAPVVDQNPCYLGRSKWIVSMQAISCSSLLLMAWFYSGDLASFGLGAILLLLLINTSSATQDIATDGLTVSLVSERFRGFANSIQVVGYKLGMLAGGSGLLIASAYVSSSILLQLIAAALIVLLLPLLLFKGKIERSATTPKLTDSPVINDTAVSIRTTSHILPWRAYVGFFKVPHVGLWLAVLFSYKLADSLGSGMLKPMLVDLGYSLEDIGYITFLASLCGMVGALLGGLFFKYLGAARSLVVFGLLQAVFVSSFYFIAEFSLSYFMITALVVLEQVADGASTVALFAVMMWHCRDAHEGADYTLQMCAQILFAGLLGALSGLVAKHFDYSGLYQLCAVFSVFTMVLVIKYAREDLSHLKKQQG